MKAFVVESVQVHRTTKGRARMSFGFATHDADEFQPTPGYTLAAYRVECTTKAEAAGIVMHWLVEGRPRAMTVRQVFPTLGIGSMLTEDRQQQRVIDDPEAHDLDVVFAVMGRHWSCSRFEAAERITTALLTKDADDDGE